MLWTLYLTLLRLLSQENEMGGIRSPHSEKSNAYKIIASTSQAKSYLGDLDVDERIILKWILRQ
jgi:hypothetical protein